MKELCGFIKFKHDNQEFCFETKRNNLTGDQMFTFDNWTCCFASDKRQVKTIIKNIHKNALVLEANI